MSSVKEDHAPTASPDGLTEATAQAQADDGGGSSKLAESGNIDKIRQILFGGQMRDYEKRFSRLEERLLKESADLRDETKKRFDSLETFIRNELEALTARLQAEQREREESAQSLSREMQEASRSLEKKLGQFDEQNTRSQRDLRQQILDQSKSLSDDIRHKHEEISAMLAREVAELSRDKTDRSALAALFSEVALRLSDEFKIPGDE
jgi:DNA anti-recombination protein RmuC